MTCKTTICIQLSTATSSLGEMDFLMNKTASVILVSIAISNYNLGAH